MDIYNEDVHEELLALSLLIIVFCMTEMLISERRWWVRPSLLFRNEYGQFKKHFKFIQEHDEDSFYDYTRMTPTQFDLLLNLMTPRLQKRSIRKPIPPEMRLCLTIFYLATGASFKTIASNFLIGRSTVSKIIRETCECLWDVLSPMYAQSPSAEDWKLIAKDFYEKWNLPNCIGSVDGKDVTIKCPNKSGTLFFNYKRTFSIVLLAVADANCNIIFADVGSYGAESDGGIFANSGIGKAFDKKSLNIPVDEILPNSMIRFPFYLAGDEAFPLKKYIMRPYPGLNLNITQKVFNYRLSRGRRIVENTFGILCSRWRVLWSTIDAKPETVDSIICSCIALHNFINKSTEIFNNRRYQHDPYNDFYDNEGRLQPGLWRNNIPENMATEININVDRENEMIHFLRGTLATYFTTPPGEVPWQYDKVNRGR